jgi:hypothetical protein
MTDLKLNFKDQHTITIHRVLHGYILDIRRPDMYDRAPYSMDAFSSFDSLVKYLRKEWVNERDR